jgi:2-polyprenyl-6-hydroxyphenyl methylase/3-demethylubiquinone-9 3-methyltransferase
MAAPAATPARETPCKICRGKAILFGVVDFNKSCEDRRGRAAPSLGIPIHYRRCIECGFLFTEYFDRWSLDEFRQHIYDEHYDSVDPDYRDKRPTALAQMVLGTFPTLPPDTPILDFGGGNGVFAQRLGEAGFTHAQTYDPLTPEFAEPPVGQFPLVTCFETLEHVPDPIATIAAIAHLTAKPGLVMFSTLLQGAEFARRGMEWWYIGPRNGHISLYTPRALQLAWAREGYRMVSINENLHMAFREAPNFASLLLGWRSDPNRRTAPQSGSE